MKVRVGAATDIGQVREGNEDSYLLLEPLFAVADGIGGHRGGEVASNLAIDTVRELFLAGEGSLTEQVERANRVVYERSSTDREVQGMGTTLTAALVEGSRIRVAHVGDSRAYVFRDGRLHMLTKDHTLVAKMVEDGEITAAEAETHPHRSIVTRALGVESTVEVDEGVLEMRPGDRLLLCSDGLTGMVDRDGIERILRDTPDPQAAVERLIRAANDAGGVDNITAVLLDFVEDDATGDTQDATVTDAPPATTSAVVETTRGGEEPTTATPAVPLEPAALRPAPATSSVSSGRPHAATARKVGLWAGVVLAVGVLGVVGMRFYLDRQWFVGISDGRVAVFRGVPADVAGVELNSVVEETEIPAAQATQLEIWRDLPDGITADDRANAESIVVQIRKDVAHQAAGTSP